MSQTVVGIEKIKDFDTARALDSLGTTLSNIATAYSGGVNQIQLTGTATGVVPTIAVGGTSVDTNIGIQLKGHGTGSVYIGGTGTTAASGAEVAAVTSAVNHVILTPAATGNSPVISAGGSGADANSPLLITALASGTGSVYVGGSSLATASAQFVKTASAVNQLIVTPAATGNPTILSVGGSGADANAALLITALASGTGAVYIGGAGSLATAGLQVTKTSSAVNQLVVTPAATGNAVQVYVGGSGVDSNATLSIQAHGTGAIHIGGTGTTDSSVQIASVASAVNKLVVTPSATGNALVVALGGAGADANRDMQLRGNGTGGALVKGRTDGAAQTAGYIGEVKGDKVFSNATTATVTITSANPGVVTWTSHGFSADVYQPVVFTTTGALPTNIVSGTVYYAVKIDANTFNLATTIANAVAGTFIDTTAGAQSGTQTGTAGCALANTTAINVTGMSLTAGIWDVWGEMIWTLNSATTWTVLESSISQTTATLASAGTVRGTSYSIQAQISAAATNGTTSKELPHCYLNISSTTTIFLVAKAAFATNTANASGFLFARRVG